MALQYPRPLRPVSPPEPRAPTDLDHTGSAELSDWTTHYPRQTWASPGSRMVLEHVNNWLVSMPGDPHGIGNGLPELMCGTRQQRSRLAAMQGLP